MHLYFYPSEHMTFVSVDLYHLFLAYGLNFVTEVMKRERIVLSCWHSKIEFGKKPSYWFEKVHFGDPFWSFQITQPFHTYWKLTILPLKSYQKVYSQGKENWVRQKENLSKRSLSFLALENYEMKKLTVMILFPLRTELPGLNPGYNHIN